MRIEIGPNLTEAIVFGGVLALLALASCQAALAQPILDAAPNVSAETSEAPARDRSVLDRAAVVGSVTVPLAAGAGLMGYADGLVNEWGWCVDRSGRGGECLALVYDRHTADAGGRSLVLVALASGAVATSVADLDLLEVGLVSLSSSMAAGMAFNLGHNLQQGQRYDYLGTIAPTDRLGRALGPSGVFWGSAAVTAAVITITILVLR